MWLPDGTYNDVPITDDEIRRDVFAWSIIQEGLRIKLFTTGDAADDECLVRADLRSRTAQNHLRGVGATVITACAGPLMPTSDSDNLTGYALDHGYHETFIKRTEVDDRVRILWPPIRPSTSPWMRHDTDYP